MAIICVKGKQYRQPYCHKTAPQTAAQKHPKLLRPAKSLCIDCGQEFDSARTTHIRCHSCARQQSKQKQIQWRLTHLEETQKYGREHYQPKTPTQSFCIDCNQEIKAIRETKLRCTSCNIQYRKSCSQSYRQNHHEELLQKGKLYHQLHRTDIILTCPDCGKEFIKTGHRQVRCTDCHKIRQAQHHRRYAQIAKANRLPSICVDCQREFIREGNLTRCPSCSQIRKDKKLERLQQLQERRTQSHEDFRESENQRHRLWSETHREKLKQESRAYNKANPDKRRLWEQARRARKLEVGGVITEEEWLELCDKFGNRCLSCGSTKKLTLDHVIPISLGGSNTIDNAQPLCRSCNSHKGAKIIDYRVS